MWTAPFFLITLAAVRLIKVALMLAKIVNKPQSVHVTELSVLPPFLFFWFYSYVLSKPNASPS